MNHSTKKLILVSLIFLAGFANGQVVQKETGDALIIVSRPIEMWTPDSKYNKLILDTVKEKQSSFAYTEPNGKYIAILKTLFQDPARAAVADEVVAKLTNAGYANANSAVIGNSVAFDLGASVQKFGKILVPRPLPQIDVTNYEQADIYRVTSLKSVGMVIIAYKEPKTLETERAALAEAIFSLTGADTTPETIIEERQKDFAMRKQIWSECVQRGDCSD